jgi:hypothetical protein
MKEKHASGWRIERVRRVLALTESRNNAPVVCADHPFLVEDLKSLIDRGERLVEAVRATCAGIDAHEALDDPDRPVEFTGELRAALAEYDA